MTFHVIGAGLRCSFLR